MEFRPCIDIHNGHVKQIVGSSLKDSGEVKENFVSDKNADYFASLYRANNLKGGHAIILNKFGTNEYEDSKEQAIKAFNAYPEGIQIGGGINDSNASDFINLGASALIVTSFLFEENVLSFEKMKRLSSTVGKDRVVFDLSCREINGEYYITTNRWQTITDTRVDLDLLDKMSEYCFEYLIHAVDVEGKSNGPETKLLEKLSEYEGNAITYAGGIHSYSDIELIKEIGKGRINFTIGSSLDLFGGNLSFDKIIKMQSI